MKSRGLGGGAYRPTKTVRGTRTVGCVPTNLGEEGTDCGQRSELRSAQAETATEAGVRWPLQVGRQGTVRLQKVGRDAELSTERPGIRSHSRGVRAPEGKVDIECGLVDDHHLSVRRVASGLEPDHVYAARRARSGREQHLMTTRGLYFVDEYLDAVTE